MSTLIIGILLGCFFTACAKPMLKSVYIWFENWIHRVKTDHFLEKQIDWGKPIERGTYPSEEDVDPPGGYVKKR